MVLRCYTKSSKYYMSVPQSNIFLFRNSVVVMQYQKLENYLFACTSSKLLDLQMLPSSEMAARVVDNKLDEPHLKLLISHLPVLLSCVTHDWVIRLLQVRSSVQLLALQQLQHE